MIQGAAQGFPEDDNDPACGWLTSQLTCKLMLHG
jgi:hypothetical protein